MGDGGLDGISMGEAHHHAGNMGRAQCLQRSDDPCLHFREALAVRETEGRGAVLNGLPLRQGGHVRQSSPRPVAEIALEQAVVVLYVQSSASRGRLRRLTGALKRRGIDGVDRKVPETLRDLFSLGAAGVGQMQPRCPPRQHPARRRRHPMAHQKEQGARRTRGRCRRFRRRCCSHQHPAYSAPGVIAQGICTNPSIRRPEEVYRRGVSDRPDIFTVGELRASGHVHKDLRREIRDNLLAALAAGRDPWPGMFGFSRTVLPQLERALLAGHDVVLLGERGQGKTRLLRTLAGLLDEWSPAIEDSELNEHPYEPITEQSRARALTEGDRLRVAWRHRSERYVEKLATPDTSVADLIGDIDPMRVAEGRRLGDPETIHYGLVPRSNRGIIAINELPDLAERIQVSMLNVMEERDIQIRGYVLRLPLDVLVVASANPEDYTNRGRIITPLRDRFGAEIRTHYPLELDDEVAVIRQEGHLVAGVPPVILEILARYTRALRQSPAINQTSGVSARFAIAGAETVAAAALRRASVRGEDEAVARIIDLDAAVEVLGGKIEFESGEQGREQEILDHLLRMATAEAVRAHFHGIDMGQLVAALDGHTTVTTGELVTAREFLENLPSLNGSGLYDQISERLGATSDGQRAAAVELALEGLYLARRIAKESDDEATIYG